MSSNAVHPFSNESSLPLEYQNLISELEHEVVSSQPDDILKFCLDFFLKKVFDERTQLKSSHDISHSNDAIMRNSDVVMHQPDEVTNRQVEEEAADFVSNDLPTFQSAKYRNRRVSVSAESMQPNKKLTSLLHKRVPKSPTEEMMIKKSLKDHFLFNELDNDQSRDVIDSMEDKKYKKGDTVIKQGAAGDYFYIVSQGTLDCFINGEKVTSYERGGSFGELALMYNAPRAATIIATSDTVLWALDRIAFRSIIIDNNSSKRKMHTQFLEYVPLFKSLELSEIHKIADALEPIRYRDGEIVLKQGDAGDNFYLIEDGEALFYKSSPDGSQVLVNQLKKGDYFGELALLNDAPRAATVVSKGDLKCVTLGKAAFTRLLGPVMDILKRNMTNYHEILKNANSS
ncbi:cAMP dependent protein kinase regulatory subunit [Pilobolus umbonatus]|nr:cAMP dependent protein kinase regulatory subunit [Pilobolus umbonatus]